MKIGFLGGSFDPIHLAHLVMADACLDLAALDRVTFVVAASPPHKQDRRLAPLEHRLAMARLAVRKDPRIDIDDREMRRSGPSWTIDTVRLLLDDHPSEDRLFWIIGADSLPELVLWRDIEELLDLVGFITAVRPGYEVEPALAQLEARLGSERVRKLAAGVIHMPRMEISSTDIRSRIASERSIRYLVPEVVADYIHRHRLYLDSSPSGCV